MAFNKCGKDDTLLVIKQMWEGQHSFGDEKKRKEENNDAHTILLNNSKAFERRIISEHRCALNTCIVIK